MTAPTRTGGPSVGAIFAQLAGAVVGGLIMAVLGYIVIGYALQPTQIGMGLLIIQVWAAIAGLGIGAGLGAGLVGRAMGNAGNMWLAALVGGVTGFLVILVLRLLNIGGFNGLFLVGIPVTLIAAVAAYNWGRR